ncbi:MAG TPA: SsrA-binding protein SmpB [Candidatus Wallbacteria bacterium]|nr:SsrA-binding protein SmpB [Candidatus Wallbacteria bacterium]
MEGIKIVATNRKAHFNYEVIETYEAGVVLMGTEIKSVRDGKISIGDSYCIARNGEVMMINSHIDEYTFGNRFNHEPKRTRKLLLHKKEILRLIGKTSERGFSIIPLKAYFKRGRLKVEIALCRGKKAFDKKETLKERDLKKQFQKEIKGNY